MSVSADFRPCKGHNLSVAEEKYLDRVSMRSSRGARGGGGGARRAWPPRHHRPTTLPIQLASIIWSRLAKLLSRWLQPTPCSYFSPPPY